jgi:hypothetical protein
MTALRLPLAVALVSAFGLFAPPLAAQTVNLGGMVTGLDVDRVVQIARAYGPAERRLDDVEDGPWIRAEMDGIIYTISFLNCTAGTNCTSAQFRAWWTSDGAHSVEEMNRWNRERRFSAAYLDSNNNATLEYDVNLAGGVTAVNFDDTLQWWQAVLIEFRDTVVDPGYGTSTPPAGDAPARSK